MYPRESMDSREGFDLVCPDCGVAFASCACDDDSEPNENDLFEMDQEWKKWQDEQEDVYDDDEYDDSDDYEDYNEFLDDYDTYD
jgi:hypothetical protein